MSYVAPDPDAFMGTKVGNGQCVAYVKAAAGCPETSKWSEGKKVRGAKIARGTAIATFQDGVYHNYTDGRSHAAIYIGQNATGLIVHDQWTERPVHERTISFRNGGTTPNNDGDAFNVIEDIRVLTRITNAKKRSVKNKSIE